MNARWSKEIAPLRLPWTVAAVCGILVALTPWLNSGLTDPLPLPGAMLKHVVLPMAPVVFVVALLVLAAMTFGVEFQCRTLALCLAQPEERTRLWRDKLFVMSSAVAAALFIHLAFRSLGGWYRTGADLPLPVSKEDSALIAVFLLAAVCSTTFWTLQARSTIGGAVFTQVAIFLGILVAEGIGYEAQRRLNLDLEVWEPRFKTILAIAALPYSALFLWLGFKKFARLEVRDGSRTELALPEVTAAWLARRSGWLRCRRGTGWKGDATANLVRKELRLQQPTWIVSAVFAGAWLVLVAMGWLLPARAEFFGLLLNVLTGAQVAVVLLLSACVTLGEEKTLGMAAWQLTLPVNAQRQWAIKLAIGAATWILLGWVLPLALAAMTAPNAETGLLALWQDSVFGILLLVCSAVFTLAFWTMTFETSTVRAALLCLIGTATLGACAALGVWSGEKSGGLIEPLLLQITARFHLPLDYFARPGPFNSPTLFMLLLVPAILGALVQSRNMFRRTLVRLPVVAKNFAVLGLLMFLPWFGVSDCVESTKQLTRSSLVNELSLTIPAFAVPGSEPPWRVSSDQLAATGKLSELTRAWLDHARVTITAAGLAGNLIIYGVTIDFPNGLEEYLTCQPPGASNQQYWFKGTPRASPRELKKH